MSFMRTTKYKISKDEKYIYMVGSNTYIGIWTRTPDTIRIVQRIMLVVSDLHIEMVINATSLDEHPFPSSVCIEEHIFSFLKILQMYANPRRMTMYQTLFNSSLYIWMILIKYRRCNLRIKLILLCIRWHA